MQFFAPLISEDGIHISMGRVLLWTVFGYLTYFWFATSTVPPSLLATFEWLIVYNFGKKLIDPLKDFVAAKSGK